MKNILFYLAGLFIVMNASAQQSGQTKLVHSKMQSKVLNTTRTYTVLLPASYETNKTKKYPVLYLLHGLMDTDSSWQHKGNVKEHVDKIMASGNVKEMIIVTPNAGGDVFNGFWNGYFDMPEWKYETFFFTEFLPYIEKTYRIIGNKQNRAIAGLSMGGGGTTVYAQKHSDMFCAAFPMSALMQREDQYNNIPRHMKQWYALNEAVKENDCVEFVLNADEPTLEKLRSVKWFLDCGDDDFLLKYNLNFVNAMHAKKVPIEFRVRDGGHVWDYWKGSLYLCLPFVSGVFQE